MRILRLDLGNGRLDLHPFVTVLPGLAPEVRSAVIAAVRALAAGRDPGTGGVVACQGLLIELPASGRDVGGVAADVAVDLDAGPFPADPQAIVDAVLRALGGDDGVEGRDSVPLVLHGRLVGLPGHGVVDLLERLELERDRAQLVVVTDHPAAARWATEVGPRRALRWHPT